MRDVDRGVGRLGAGPADLLRPGREPRACSSTAGSPSARSELLAVELPARSQAAADRHLLRPAAAEINIHYAYPLLLRPRGPSLALYVDDPTLAAQMLIRKKGSR